MKINTFYSVDYIPNRLAYVYKIEGKKIHFLAFPNENKSLKHSTNVKSDFKKLKVCYNPTKKLKETIKKAL